MTQFLERMYGKLIIDIHQGRYGYGSLLRIMILTTNESRQRYFIYCPDSEIHITSIFKFGDGLQINLHPNSFEYIWSDRICDYLDGVGKKVLILGYRNKHFQPEKFPTIKSTLDNLIELSKKHPELGDACAGVWEKNCFPRNIPYLPQYDQLFI